LVPFNAPCVVARLAAESGVGPPEVALDLERWAESLGGELVEGEVLWLPADPFDTL
jgi:hypothetical protein